MTPGRPRRLPGPRLALLSLFLMAALVPYGVAPAAGGGDPPAFRNARNQFTFMRSRKPAPMTLILAAGGDLLDLGRFRGKVVLLNFWATWCTPCIRELPAVDRLQSTLGGQGLEVVALSIDDTGIDAPASFARRLGLTHLNVYLDFTGTTAEAFPLYGLPISYLIDREGVLLGYIVGAVKWDSPDAVSFLGYYLGRSSSGAGG